MVEARGAEAVRDGLPRPAAGRLAPRKLWLLAWLAFLPIALACAENFSESDTFWQIRTGILTLEAGRFPTADPFSWTAAGEPWTLNSWGFNILLAVAYNAGGLPGVALICAVIVFAIFGLVLLLARNLGASAAVAAWLLFPACLVLIIWFSARPQLMDYLAVLFLVIILRQLLDAPSLRQLGGLALLITVWVNLHAASLLGVAIVGGTLVLAGLQKNTRRRVGWLSGALALALLCSLATPYGIGIFSQITQVKAASTVITEWQPLNLADPRELVPFALGLVALVIAARRREIVLSAALVTSLAGSVAAMRIIPILFLVSLPILMSAASHPVVLRYFESRRRMLAQCGSLAVAAVIVLVAINLPGVGRPDPAVYPTDAIGAIPAGCTVFNDYLVGGLVILQRPDVRVSLDSRNDLYGADRVNNFMRFIEKGDGDLAERLSGADCVLVPPSSGLARSLRADPRWKLETDESAAALFVHVPGT
ncbi:hypothetical protein E5206_07035 [Arthrobacter sp. PAMC25564]|uniref:hypothetical protein n=1 Tax=Arthrobacter sp. PAMC25564 TaxID=2565366 RepID=UPI0010A201C4|nr:hypothetical protein [Arthrobacter sp. PAMC25564]QCB96713.1 hypothetical protein E5206_07035 [Arthrobacter sp. PAMC25564]